MTPEQLARNVDRLRGDETFQTVIQRIEDTQVKVFLNAGTSSEDLAEARVIVRGLAAIKREMKAIIDRENLAQKKKGQHRGSD